MKEYFVILCNDRGLLYHFTTAALLKITDNISMDLDLNWTILLLDFSKVFDTVNFVLLCQELKNQFNFSDSAIDNLKSYLMDADDAQIYLSAMKKILNW
jgi:hypothetical protein